MNPFEARLSAALEHPQKDKIYLAAVSGGADSTSMLAGLEALRKETGFALHCVHVEHGLRPVEESCGDAQAVEVLCKQLDVPCRVISIPQGKIAAFASRGGTGIQAAARYFRRKAWNRERRRINADKILTAHTLDDLLETLLMRILRGSGPAGLALMPRTRGRLSRPLLDLKRLDVLEYLEHRGIPYRTDASNADFRYLRSRVRHKLIPFLNDFFPSWQVSLLALGKTQSLTAEFLAAETGKRLPWELESKAFAESDAIKSATLRLREEDFFAAPSVLREEAIFAGVDKLADICKRGKIRKSWQVPRRQTIRRAATEKPEGHAAVQDLGPVRLERQGGFLRMISSRQFRGERGFSLLIKEAGFYTLKRIFPGKRYGLRVSPATPPKDEGLSATPDVESNAAFHAAFYAQLPLVLRNHRGGDRILKGGHRRRFSAILDKSARAGYDYIITACDVNGPAAFIICGKGGEVKVISRDFAGVSETGRENVFKLSGESRFH